MEDGQVIIGRRLKEVMYQKGLSLRKLSKQVDIDVSTLSRMINNKQKPNMNHLEKLSEALDMPFDELLVDMGYDFKLNKRVSSNSLDRLIAEGKVGNEDIFNICTHLEDEKVVNDIEKELDKYSQYMYMPEGKEMIMNGFESKLKSVGQIGPVIELIKSLYQEFCQLDITLAMAILIGSGLLYFIISPDVIPDFLFPLGFIDDVIAIKMIKRKIDQI